MQKVINEILVEAKLAYKASVTLEDKLLSIISNAKSILNELETNENNEKLSIRNDEEIQLEEVEKIKRKVPLWLNRPNQFNYKILTNFMKLSENNKYPVSVSLLETHSDIEDNIKFISHYNQMKIISEKNHGKIFNEENGQVTLWEPIKDLVINQYISK